MTYRETVRWLYRYLDAKRLQVCLEQELAEIKSTASRVTPALTGMPGGGGDGQSMARAVESIVDAQQKLAAQINVCGATRREVVAVINRLDDERLHEVLRRRYLLGQKWEDIAEAMSYAHRSVFKLHRQAVQQVGIFLQ